MRTTVLSVLLVLLTGCANPGVQQLSGDTYFISKSSAAGAFVNLPALKAEVIREANAFAAKQGKVAEPISINHSQPHHGFPSVDYQFRLVTKTNTPAQ